VPPVPASPLPFTDGRPAISGAGILLPLAAGTITVLQEGSKASRPLFDATRQQPISEYTGFTHFSSWHAIPYKQ